MNQGDGPGLWVYLWALLTQAWALLFQRRKPARPPAPLPPIRFDADNDEPVSGWLNDADLLRTLPDGTEERSTDLGQTWEPVTFPIDSPSRDPEPSP